MQKVVLLEVFHHTAKTKFNEKRADMQLALQNFTFDFVVVLCRAKRPKKYCENRRSHERVSNKSKSSRPPFSQEIKESLGSHEECGKVFSSRKDHSPLSTNP